MHRCLLVLVFCVLCLCVIRVVALMNGQAIMSLGVEEERRVQVDKEMGVFGVSLA